MSIIDFESQGTIGVNVRPTRIDMEIYQGDSFDIVLQCKDSLGAAVDLTGVTAKVSFVGLSPTPTPSVQPTVAITAETGKIRVYLDDTSALNSPGEYGWDVQLIQDTKKRTYIGGKLTITKDISPDA